MSATNQTEFLKLGQYIAQDKPSFLGTYNSDMQTIDSFAEDASSKLEQLQDNNTQNDITTEKIQDDIEELQTDLGTVKETVKNVPQDEQNITDLLQDMATAKQDITGIKQNNLQTAETINTLVTDVGELKNEFDTLENVSQDVYIVNINMGSSQYETYQLPDEVQGKLSNHKLYYQISTYVNTSTNYNGSNMIASGVRNVSEFANKLALVKPNTFAFGKASASQARNEMIIRQELISDVSLQINSTTISIYTDLTTRPTIIETDENNFVKIKDWGSNSILKPNVNVLLIFFK